MIYDLSIVLENEHIKLHTQGDILPLRLLTTERK